MAGGGSSAPIRSAAGAPSRVVGPSSRPRPTQPSPVWSCSSSRADCQIAMLRKCERFGFGYPTPGTIASRPDSSSLPASPIAGCRPTSPLTLISRFSGSRIALRCLAYPSSLNGTTVLMPSLPPFELQDDQDAAVFLGAGGVRRAPGNRAAWAPARSASNSADRGRGSLDV